MATKNATTKNIKNNEGVKGMKNARTKNENKKRFNKGGKNSKKAAAYKAAHKENITIHQFYRRNLSAFLTTGRSFDKQEASIKRAVKRKLATMVDNHPELTEFSQYLLNLDKTIDKSEIENVTPFSIDELSAGLGLTEALEKQLILHAENKKGNLSKKEAKRLVSEDVIALFNNGDFAKPENLKAISVADIRKMGLNRITLKSEEDVERAIQTLNPSIAFIANLQDLKATGNTYYQMFANIKSAFVYTGGDVEKYGNAFEDAVNFLKYFKFEKKAPTKMDQIVVRKATINNLETKTYVLKDENGQEIKENISRTFITTDEDGITRVNVEQEYQMMSTSQLISYINEMFQDDEAKLTRYEYLLSKTGAENRIGNTDDAERQEFLQFMSHLLYVDASMDLSENKDDNEQTKANKVYLRQMQQLAVLNGLNVYSYNSEEKAFDIVGRFGLFIQTASQGRNQGFIALEGAHNEIKAVKALEAMGHEFISYAKQRKDGTYEIKVDKMTSRPGLSGSNSRAIPELDKRLEGAHVQELAPGMREIVTDSGMKVLLAKDFEFTVTEGKYRVLDAVNAYKSMVDKAEQKVRAYKFKTLDASKNPVTLTVGDGAFYYGDELHKIILILTGKDAGVHQFRISPATKGLGIYIPGLESKTGYGMILPESTVKVPYETVNLSEHPLKFALVNYGKENGKLKNHFKLNYQFLAALLDIDVNVLTRIIEKTFKDIDKISADPEKLRDYKHFKHIIDTIEDAMENDDAASAEKAAQTLITTFDRVFAVGCEEVKNDAWIKVQANKMMAKAFQKYGRGELMVKGNYRFLVQDPIGVINHYIKNIEAVRTGKPENISWEFTKELAVIDANIVYLPANVKHDPKKCIEQEVVAMRAPFIDPSEGQKLEAKDYDAYRELRDNNHAFVSSIAVMSGLDFCLFAMGGADTDGDKAGFILDKEIVKSFKTTPPVLDFSIIDVKDDEYILGEGCIFRDTTRDFPTLISDKIQKDPNNGWTITFKLEDYYADYEVRVAIFNYMKRYILDGMQPSKVGLYTDYATKVLDAIHVLNGALKSEKDAKVIKYIEGRIDVLRGYVELLRIVQGWEIDRTKHGGAFEDYLNLDFLANPPEEVALRDADGKLVYTEEGNLVWAPLTWLELYRGKTMQQVRYKRRNLSKLYKGYNFNYTDDQLFTASTQSVITKLAYDLYEERFGENVVVEANLNTDNLLSKVTSLVFADPSTTEIIRHDIGRMISKYNIQVRNMMIYFNNKIDNIKQGFVYYPSKRDKYKAIEKLEAERSQAQKDINAYHADVLANYYNGIRANNPQADLLLAKLAYERTYTNAIERWNQLFAENPDEAIKSPTRGTSYFWNVASDFAVALFAYMNNHKSYIKYNQAKIKQRIEELGFEQTIDVSIARDLRGDAVALCEDINAALESSETQGIIRAVRVHQTDGGEAYMVELGGQCFGFVPFNQKAKLGGQDYILIKADRVEPYIKKNGNVSQNTIRLVYTDTTYFDAIPENKKAYYFDMAYVNGLAF